MDRITCGKLTVNGKVMVRFVAAIGASICLANCDAAQTQGSFAFRDRTSELGLQLSNSPACWINIDNDGWTDLCAGGIVWRNESGNGFVKLAEGFGNVVAADFDNDGFEDLFSLTSIQVFRNQNGKGFEPVSMPELPKTVSLGACWGDINGDGFVDLYVGGYEDWNDGITYPDLLILNQNGKSFTLAWSETRFRARGVTSCDFDQDGDLDVYVSNYRLQPNLLWVNDGTGQLQDMAHEYDVVGTTTEFPGGHSIGSAWGDFDNDGNFDLFAGNFAHVDHRGDQPKSRFLRNPGKPPGQMFKDLGPCGIHYQESYASPAVGDFDNDGDVDLYFTTVYETAGFGRKNHPVLFRNDGDFVFVDDTTTAGLSLLPATYQAAWADFDNDGDLDLVTAGKLFENLAAEGHWLELQLEGDGPTVNRSAIGTQVRIALPNRTLTRQVAAGTGQGNQDDLVLHFGLGDHSTAVRLEIFWPGGTTQTVENVPVNSRRTVRFSKRP